MSLAEQFTGLQMDQLIGGPLSAAADASIMLAGSTADFINKVGFDKDGKVRTAAFGYQRMQPNEDGTSSLDEMKVDVPMISIVPIPNLQIDEVNVLFDMEVKNSEKSNSSFDLGAKLEGSLDLGVATVKISGNVSSHSENTRSSDNSAKYHVDVRATNHGTPEGLARVLDMMAANVAPALLSSEIRDDNGNKLPDNERRQAESLKRLREEILKLEKRKSAAEDSYNRFLFIVQKNTDNYRNEILENVEKQISLIAEIEKKDPTTQDENDKKLLGNKATILRTCDKLSKFWKNYAEQFRDMVVQNADEFKDKDNTAVLEALDLKNANADFTDTVIISDDDKYATAFKQATKAYLLVEQIDGEISAKREEYNDTMAGLK